MTFIFILESFDFESHLPELKNNQRRVHYCWQQKSEEKSLDKRKNLEFVTVEKKRLVRPNSDRGGNLRKRLPIVEVTFGRYSILMKPVTPWAVPVDHLVRLNGSRGATPFLYTGKATQYLRVRRVFYSYNTLETCKSLQNYCCLQVFLWSNTTTIERFLLFSF